MGRSKQLHAPKSILAVPQEWQEIHYLSERTTGVLFPIDSALIWANAKHYKDNPTYDAHLQTQYLHRRRREGDESRWIMSKRRIAEDRKRHRASKRGSARVSDRGGKLSCCSYCCCWWPFIAAITCCTREVRVGTFTSSFASLEELRACQCSCHRRRTFVSSPLVSISDKREFWVSLLILGVLCT